MSEALKTLSRARILLVEDDEDIRRSVADLLEDAGYEIEEAENGLQAYEKLQATKQLPALILLDLMMPVMSGGELVIQLAKEPRLRLIPIVVLSAHLGAFSNVNNLDCLPKPFSAQHLLEVVANYCG